MIEGRRVYNKQDDYSFGNMKPGDYGIGPDGRWWLCSPNGARGVIDLSKHLVTSHEDGTITVSPSVHFTEGWHGWLERGTWREA